MTLTVHDQLEQGTSEWHEQRRGMLTASVVGKLITPTLEVANNETSRKLTATLAAERISGNTDPTYMNMDMWRGRDDEPRAIEVYSEHYAPVKRVGFMVEDKWGCSLGYSPDGLVGEDGLIEVKSRRQSTQVLDVVGGEVPTANMAQIQCGLLVSGRAWCDYISYCGGLHLWPKRVEPDEEWQTAILEALDVFEVNVAALVHQYRTATKGLPMTERVPDVYEVELKL